MLSVWTQVFISLHLPSRASDKGHLFVRLWRRAKIKLFWTGLRAGLPSLSLWDFLERRKHAWLMQWLYPVHVLHQWFANAWLDFSGVCRCPCTGCSSSSDLAIRLTILSQTNGQNCFFQPSKISGQKNWNQTWGKQEGGLLNLLLVKYHLLSCTSGCLIILSELHI